MPTAKDRPVRCRTGQHPSVEARKVRKNGTQLWVRETAWAIVGKPRRPSVLVVSEDITNPGAGPSSSRTMRTMTP